MCVQCARTVCAMYTYGVCSAHVQCVQCTCTVCAMYMYNVYVMYRYSVCNVYVRLGNVPVQSGECVCVHNLHVDS